MIKTPSYYREGLANLKLGDVFFRADSIFARDLSILFAYRQLINLENSSSKITWLDLMAGNGIRSLRWALETDDSAREERANTPNLEIWANDANKYAYELLKENLGHIRKEKISIISTNKKAERLLYETYVNKNFIHLIDIDCFGCPNYLLQPALRVLSFNGFLLLSSTNARSITGHDRKAGIRHFGALSRVHSASWEIGLRLQISAIAKQAWLLGRGIRPLLSFSDGRTFRVCIQLTKNIHNNDEDKIGFISKCNTCGDQIIIPLNDLKDFGMCSCEDNPCRKIINGPLWIGEIQNRIFLEELINIAEMTKIPISIKSKRILKKLKNDPGVPARCWPTSELARRFALPNQPKIDHLVHDLKEGGFFATKSSIMAGQIRTNAPLREIYRILH